MNYYLEDGGLRVCGCAGCTAGEHAYDLEVVVVELGSEGVSGEGYATLLLTVFVAVLVNFACR